MAYDSEIFSLIEKENTRQHEGLELIASENYVSQQVLDATGSILTNKYAEGYPKKRYYGGCSYVDEIEQLTIDRAKKLFRADYVNVQPHSGSSANIAAFFALAPKGGKILGLDLSHGGHLTHGASINFSGFLFEAHSYCLNPETHLICYEEVRKKALEVKPQILIAGYSAYSRDLDYKKFREIADEAGAYLLVDMSHFSGLVASGLLNNPILYADVVTTTTHKTLRGPRGGVILSRDAEKFGKLINSKVFPGFQGGPLEHVIAAKGVCFYEALQPEFKTYSKKVIENAQAMSEVFVEKGFNLITGGTDNHLLLIDLRNKNITGKTAQLILEEAHITLNKNTVPGETQSPFVTSGIRIGSPALTTRGFGVSEMKQVAKYLCDILLNPEDQNLRLNIKKQIIKLNQNFSIYS